MNLDEIPEQKLAQKAPKHAKYIDFILIAVAVLVLLGALVFGILTST